MSDNKSASSGGISFFSLLTILFIGLKLTHYIDWEWLWVLAPMWIPAAFILGLFAFGFVMVLLGQIFKWLFRSFN